MCVIHKIDLIFLRLGASVNLDEVSDATPTASGAHTTQATPQFISSPSLQQLGFPPQFSQPGFPPQFPPQFPPVGHPQGHPTLKGNPPLFVACAHHRGEQDMNDIIQLLLERGAVDTLVCASLRGDTDAILNFLNDKNVDVNVEERGYTPLGAAASNGRVKALALLVEMGQAGVNLSTSKWGLPIHLAASVGQTKYVGQVNNQTIKGQPECIRYLANNRSAMNHPNPYGNTPLYEACAFAQVENVRTLLDCPTVRVDHVCHGHTALSIAVIKSPSEIVLELIKHGANVNFVAQNGNQQAAGHACAVTPLFMAASQLMGNDFPQTSFDSFGRKMPFLNEEKIHLIEANIKILLDNDANVNWINPTPMSGQTVLHSLCRRYSMLKLLLKVKNVQVNIQDRKGNTPLICSISNAKDVHCVRALLEAGADVSLINAAGCSALVYAAGGDGSVGVEILRMLLNTGLTNVNALTVPSANHIAAPPNAQHMLSKMTPLYSTCASLQTPEVFKGIITLLFSRGMFVWGGTMVV